MPKELKPKEIQSVQSISNQSCFPKLRFYGKRGLLAMEQRKQHLERSHLLEALSTTFCFCFRNILCSFMIRNGK